MTRTRSRRLASGTLALTLAFGAAAGLGACGGDDVSKDTFRDQLVDAGTPEEAATCIVDDLYADLDQDDINKMYEADTEEEAGAETFEAYTAIVTACVTPEGSGETTEPELPAEDEG